MADGDFCPRCGARVPGDAPQGLCPACLMAFAMEDGPSDPSLLNQPIGTTRPNVRFHDSLTEVNALTIEHISDPDIPAGPARTGPLGTLRYFGDYELLSEIARGGMGVVFRARQASLNRPVALKMILASRLAGEADVQRFLAEAEAAANLDHPNIVPIYEIGEHDGQRYFSMKLIEGSSLSARIALLKSDPRASAALLATIARAVHHAHQRGILHRDLKPANILLDRENVPYITDFGLAKKVEGDDGLTQSGAIMGTPAYMPPEQATGTKGALTTASDVYSLGAILYEMLTARAPFQAESVVDLLMMVREREPDRPRSVDPRIDLDLETICLKCLEKDPKRRYQSALELAEDLERRLRGEPITARPTSTWERGVKWAKRHPMPAALVTVIGVATISLMTVVLVYNAKLRLALVSETREKEKVETERQQVLKQEKVAQEQRQLAELERAHAVAMEAAARRSLYQAHVYLARQAIIEGRVGRARDLLDRHVPREGRPDLREFAWYHLWHLANSDRFTRPALGGDVRFSPDGRSAATHQADGSIILWDLANGNRIARLPFAANRLPTAEGERAVMAFAPDGKRLATGSRNDVILWASDTGREIARLPGHPGALCAVAFGADGTLASAAGDGSIIVWDLDRKVPRTTLRAGFGSETDPILELMVAADGRKLVGRKRVGPLAIWDLGVDRPPVLLDHPKSGVVIGMRLSPDGKTLASGFVTNSVSRFLGGTNMVGMDDAGMPGSAGEVFVWDTESGKRRHRLIGYSGKVQSLAFHPDGATLAGGSVGTQSFQFGDGVQKDEPGQLILWDVATGQKRHSRDFPGGVWSLAFASDGKALACGVGAYGRIVMSDSTPDAASVALKTFDGHDGPVLTLAFSADGKRVMSGSADQKFKVWDTTTATEPLTWNNKGGDGDGGLSFSPDGRQLATSVSMVIRLWDVGTGGVRKIDKMDFAVGPVAFAPDGGLVTGGSSLFGRGAPGAVWDRDGLKLRTKLKGGFSDAVQVLAVSSDSRTIATIAKVPRRTNITLWDFATGERRQTLIGHQSEVTELAFSPDGKTLASGGLDHVIRLWDVSSGQLLTVLEETIPGVSTDQIVISGLAFSPDGKSLAVAVGFALALRDTRVGHLAIWDVGTRQVRKRLFDHAGPVLAVAYSPDGKTLASGGRDQTVRIWDAATGEALMVLAGPDSAVRSLAFRPDGAMLAALTNRGTIHVWNASTESDVTARTRSETSAADDQSR